MKKITSKLLALLMALAMIFSLAACGGDNDVPDTTPNATTAETEVMEMGEPDTEAPTKPAEPLPVTAALGNTQVTIVAAEEFTDDDGAPGVRFYYDFTNNDDKTRNAEGTMTAYAKQGGAELEMGYPHWEQEVPEMYYKDRRIRNGVTIRCVAEFLYDPDGGEVTLGVSDGWSDDSMEVTLTPDQFTGRPAEDFVIQTVADPKWTENLSNTGDYDDYEVKIDGIEVFDDDGTQLVRVNLTFTNKGDAACYPSTTINLEVYQDGVELMEQRPWTESESDEAYDTEVEPGATVAVSACFEVMSDSPIEVECYDYRGSAGAVFPCE